MKELGFCYLQRKKDENYTGADYILIIHPNDPFTWGFRIRNLATNKEVYYNRFAHNTTVNNTVGKFIRSLIPLIEQ